MEKTKSVLDTVRIASPCTQSWEAMAGDDRVRFCGACKLNVFNLSGMSRAEAEALLLNKQGRLCVRYYRRADGTILTQDCPVGLAAIRRQLAKLAGLAAAALAMAAAGLGLKPRRNGCAVPPLGPRMMGEVAALPANPASITGGITLDPRMGDVDVAPMMGKPAIEKPSR